MNMKLPNWIKKIGTTKECLVNNEYLVNKVLLFISNIFFLIHGFVGVLFGGFWTADTFTLKVLLQMDHHSNIEAKGVIGMLEPVGEAAMGSVEIYLALLIYCVICFELKTMLRLLCLVCLGLAVCNVAFIVLALKHVHMLHKDWDQFKKLFLDNFLRLYNAENGTDAETKFTFHMDGAQVYYGCCGVNNYLDYTNATFWKSGIDRNFTVPRTCCLLDITAYLFLNHFIFKNGHSCVDDPTPLNSNRHQGCHDSILTILNHRLIWHSVVYDILSIVFDLLSLLLLIRQVRNPNLLLAQPSSGKMDGYFVDDIEAQIWKLNQLQVDEMAANEEQLTYEEEEQDVPADAANTLGD